MGSRSELGIVACSFLCGSDLHSEATWQPQMADTAVFPAAKVRDQCARHVPLFTDLFPTEQSVIVHTGSNITKIKQLF